MSGRHCDSRKIVPAGAVGSRRSDARNSFECLHATDSARENA
jgi:hypothetical protein